ncbi:MAG: GIY-YIG nuclease family protein [Chloroflexi bacterium]|nr:MAG: GIY-YIG nuclease family protein [Chloroflexota bacterium]
MKSKKVIYAFYQRQPDITISLTLYTARQETTRRDFYLRNLSGQSEAEQVEHAQEIMNGVAEELHYLTGFGVDKGVIKTAGKKADEVIYPDYGTNFPFFYDGAMFKISQAHYYAWVRDKQRSPGIIEHLLDDSWQLKVISSPKTVSFRLPSVLINETQRRQLAPKDTYFFGFYPRSGRKQKKTNFHLFYDKEDPIFRRFIRRFDEDGNLSFGRERFFASENSEIVIMSCKWPKSKAKPKRQPRRSVLASQPADDTEYVYFIRLGRTKNYKIGKSNDPQGRLLSLQTASPYKLKLLHTFRADNATAAEESLHAALHPQRMEGEWFKLSDEQKNAVLSVDEFKDGDFIAGGESIDVKALLDS